jgi:hypothetical protein
MTVPERSLRTRWKSTWRCAARGFRLAAPAQPLGQFAGYLEARGTSTITISDALARVVLRPGHRRPGRRSGSARSAGSPPTRTAPTRRCRLHRPG